MFKLFRRTQKSEDLDRKLVFANQRRRIPRLAQLKRLPHVLSSKERWILHGAVAMAAIGLAVIATVALKGHLRAAPLSGGAYREAVVGSPRLINPVFAVSDVERDLTRLIYSSLLRYNKAGELEGDLAENFELQGDGRAIKFTLREGARFHDGEPVDPEDVAFTLRVIKDPLWRSPLTRTFQNVDISILDERSIEARADAFIPGFADLFTFGILPEHIWSQVSPETARLAVWNTKPVGSGPYRFASLAKYGDGTIQFYRLKAYEGYHREEPYISELILQFFSDFESALAAFREHTVEGVSFVPERLRERIPASGARVNSAIFPKFTALFFQDRKSTILRDRAVRLALERAIDRAVIAALVPDSRPAGAPFLESQIGHARTIALSAQDLEAASQILDDAGWKRDENGRSKGSERLSFTLTVPDERTSLVVAGAVKEMWGKLGAEVKIEAVSRGALELGILRPRSFEALLFSIISGRDPDPYVFWHSTQMDDPGLNFSSVKSREIDAALEDGRATPDDARRLEAYLRFQTLFREEIPAIVLYESPYIYAQSKRVRGSARAVMYTPADRFNDVETWYVRARPGWQ